LIVGWSGPSFHPPRWRRDGKELFYIADDGKMMAVEVKSRASFEAGAPRALFDFQSIRGIGGQYALTGDGQRQQQAGEQTPQPCCPRRDAT